MVANEISNRTILRSSKDLDPLLKKIADAKFVLLGEASHGTHEYYTWRTALTKRLIVEKGFSFIGVEGDWPDCYQINRYVKGYGAVNHAAEVLKVFNRWPTWMWANWEIVSLMEWLHDHNKPLPFSRKIGFYGLDVYSLWESMDVMVNYLRKEDPKAAKLALEALRCFEPYEEGDDYARAMLQLSADCTEEVVRLLREVRSRSKNYNHDPEAALNIEMNARVIANAEQYYRSMVSFHDKSWNIRDAHMNETLNVLMKFHGKQAKAIVWEHNTHVGDARYTDMQQEGLFNVGQLVREEHSRDGVFIVGFASRQGSVIAGKEWGGNMQVVKVPPAVKGSVEDILHQQSPENRLIIFDKEHRDEKLNGRLGHRAIGVVYHPERERGNYVPSDIQSRYDALIYLDETNALHPLHLEPDGTRMPETYPFGV
jgi:erythromycin esterase